jgi:sugar O-acyltransferase (sialic acid O-acetyltransferase NeuD family)
MDALTSTLCENVAVVDNCPESGTVIVVGGNAGARIAAEIFRSSGQHVLLLETFADVNSWVVDSGPHRLTGSIEENIEFLGRKHVNYFVATGDNDNRRSISLKMQQLLGKKPVNCIHPTAVISKSATLGCGNLILANAVVHTNASVHNGTIINTASVIEHDAEIRDFAQVAPGAILGGRVVISERAFIGIGAQIIPNICVGSDSTVAAGATVIRNVEPNSMVAGCPAVQKKLYC